jgi:hypothetical protein
MSQNFIAYIPKNWDVQNAILVDDNTRMHLYAWNITNKESYLLHKAMTPEHVLVKDTDERWIELKRFDSVEDFKQWFVEYYFDNIL